MPEESLSRRTDSVTNKPNHGRNRQDEPKEKDGKDFIAVRWPSTLRRDLKVAAAAHVPPLTMTEYLAECFNAIQEGGGLASLSKTTKSGSRATLLQPRSDKSQHKRYQEAGEKLFKTRDRRLIDCVILLLEHVVR